MGERQRIDEMHEPPVVGRRYLVPTVTYPWYGRVEPWPVMGPRHSDREHLRFEPEHYHVDIRFLTARQMRFAGRRAPSWSPGDAHVTVAGAPLSHRSQPQHPPIIYRDLSCRRVDHVYPITDTLRGNGFKALHAAYAGRRCARNAAGLLICPHKGFALDTLVLDAQGRVVCPLHGLVIDVAAGVVVAAPVPSPDAGEADRG